MADGAAAQAAKEVEKDVYSCTVTFQVNVNAATEEEAVALIRAQALKEVQDPMLGFTFLRAKDGKIFLGVDGKAIRVPDMMGGAPVQRPQMMQMPQPFNPTHR